MSRVKDMVGFRSGKLVVLERSGSRQGKAMWLCKCDCGREARIVGDELRSKTRPTQSCGCMIGQANRNRLVIYVGYDTPEYRSWSNMRRRCLDEKCPAFPKYGGRGIKICDAWRDFDTFRRDMGPRPPGTSIERIDNNGHYEPGNCRWATPTEQARNRRLAGPRRKADGLEEWSKANLVAEVRRLREALEAVWAWENALASAHKTGRDVSDGAMHLYLRACELRG